MKTGRIEICGKSYLLCLSTRVMMTLQDKGGDASEELTRILESNDMKDIFWLIEQMMDAGARYADLEDIENPKPLKYDQLIDLTSPLEYEQVFGALTESITNSTQPTVEAEPSEKNAETTQDE